MNKKEKFDLIIFLLWPIFSAIFSFVFELNNIASIILFLGVPCLYLTIRAKSHIFKSLYFSLPVSIVGMILIDYIAQKNSSWEMFPDSILSFKFFGLVTFEVILWAFLSVYFIILFYEYFIHHEIVKRNWNPKMKYLMIFLILLMLIFVFFFAINPDFLRIHYFYLIFGTVLFFIPFLLQLFTYPKITQKMFFVGAYFFYFNFIYEVTALKLGWWIFPGQEFIGYVQLFDVAFPIEELLFWFILFALSILSFYEYFDENEK
ncbi:hypothetical protein J4214_04235 [Candidatus Woesearchaeota archaeon]|nr:hypothetical protein [Candidatus Woesearchaeota archaeon]